MPYITERKDVYSNFKTMHAKTLRYISFVWSLYIALSVINMGNNSNGPVTVAEGSNVMLRCEVTGDGTLNYQWRRVSGSLPNNVTTSNGRKFLTIHNIAVNDSGQYYCVVDNGGDSVSSMRVQVTTRSELLITNCVIFN